MEEDERPIPLVVEANGAEPPPNPKTEEIDFVFLHPALHEAVLAYLKTRPFFEVENLLPSLLHAHRQKVTVYVPNDK